MKNQRLVEALEVLKDKRIKDSCLVYYSAFYSTHWSVCSAYWSAHSAQSVWSDSCSVYDSAAWSAELDKPKVLEIIKARLK